MQEFILKNYNKILIKTNFVRELYMTTIKIIGVVEFQKVGKTKETSIENACSSFVKYIINLKTFLKNFQTSKQHL